MSQNHHISHQHSIDWSEACLGLMSNLGIERAGDASKEGGLSIAVGPDVDMEAGVVGLKELAVAAYPFAKLLQGEAR